MNGAREKRSNVQQNAIMLFGILQNVRLGLHNEITEEAVTNAL